MRYTLPMGTRRYSLEDLADRSGIEARTIRSYIQQGLLRGPEAMGRNAYYVDHHLRRLKHIKRFKEFYGLQIREIRQLLLTLSDEDLEAWPGAGAVLPAREVPPPLSTPPPPQSALDFIRAVKARELAPPAAPQAHSHPRHPRPDAPDAGDADLPYGIAMARSALTVSPL